MAVIPFPQKLARTSPQLELACVAVNVTRVRREVGRDMFLEAHARVLARVWRAMWVVDDPGERAAWDAFMAADWRARGLR